VDLFANCTLNRARAAYFGTEGVYYISQNGNLEIRARLIHRYGGSTKHGTACTGQSQPQWSASSQHATRCAPRARGSPDRDNCDRLSRIRRRVRAQRDVGPGPRAGPPATAAREERDESSYHETERSPGPGVEKMTGLAPHVLTAASVRYMVGPRGRVGRSFRCRSVDLQLELHRTRFGCFLWFTP
jgi:hypothetical protein